MKYLLTLVLSVALLLSACGESTFYSHSMTLEDGIWSHGDTFENEFTVTDTAARFDLVLDIVHRRNYPFQNIYMNIHTHFPADTQVTDLLSIDLADRAGNWHGNCRGEECDLRVYLQQNVGFKDPGTYRVDFDQYTRREDLRGISSFTFKILPREISGQ